MIDAALGILQRIERPYASDLATDAQTKREQEFAVARCRNYHPLLHPDPSHHNNPSAQKKLCKQPLDLLNFAATHPEPMIRFKRNEMQLESHQ